MASFCDLPDEILIHIFGELDYKDLCSLYLVNQRCRHVASTDSMWKGLCKKHWMVDKKLDDSWRSTFITHFDQYGSYIESYCSINGAWNKLKDILNQEAPKIKDSLRDGLTEQDLTEIELHYKCKLPESLRLFYRLCGGQNTSHRAPGLFGSLANVFTHSLNSYYYLNPKTGTRAEQNETTVSYKMLPIAFDHFGNQFCMVLPCDGNDSISDGDPPAFSMVWVTTGRVFEASPSFEQWFLDYVEKISTRVYTIENGHIFRYLYEPDCVAVTGSIKVRAGWVPSQMIENSFMLYEYRITMTMDEDANPRESCKLKERHWVITHSDSGKVERVSGPGVVGEYPIMKPGAKFSWMSRTYFSPPGGSMEGHFTMESLTNSSEIEIECPRYHMHMPHEYKNVQ